MTNKEIFESIISECIRKVNKENVPVEELKEVLSKDKIYELANQGLTNCKDQEQ